LGNKKKVNAKLSTKLHNAKTELAGLDEELVKLDVNIASFLARKRARGGIDLTWERGRGKEEAKGGGSIEEVEIGTIEKPAAGGYVYPPSWSLYGVT